MTVLVPISLFKECNRNFIEVNPAYQASFKWLLENYTCFGEPDRNANDRYDRGGFGQRFGGSGGGRRHFGGGHGRGGPADIRGGAAPPPVAAAPAEKPRIGGTEFSLEHLARKDFLAILNKLSESNIETMLQNFDKKVRPDFADLYIDLFWNGFVQSLEYQPLQIRLLAVMNQQFAIRPYIDRLFARYSAERLWIPTNVPRGSSDEDYDAFCAYLKWKKRAKNTLHAWAILAKHDWVDSAALGGVCLAMAESFDAAAIQVQDSIMEQILEFARILGVPGIPPELSAKVLESWRPRAAEFEPIIRFKIYDLADLITKSKN